MTGLRSKRVAAAVLLAWLSGCLGDHTGAGLGAGVPARPAAPRVADEAAAREHARLIQSFGGEYRAPRLQALLGGVTARLVPATERPDEHYQVTILNSPVVNAFALPSGRLYVTRGLLALANSTSEVAAVLAHEIAHVTLRHASARGEAAARSELVSRVAADVLKDPDTSAMIQAQSRFTIARFSRLQELEADQVGVRTLAGAGFDPYGSTRFLAALGRNGELSLAGGASPQTSPDMLSTHPSTPERIAASLLAARRIGAPGPGEGDRAPYLQALDQISYGDNPADGVIRGRRFTHPRLGVAFEAPPGFALENTPQAVVGATPDGGRRLLFDAIEASADQTLEAVLRSTWSGDVETGGIESLTVNGRPAAIATSKGRDWSFRMAAIRLGSATYRLILAGRTAGGDFDRPFRDALDSVREITPEEVRGVRALRLQIVPAGDGDTVESLAGRMAVQDRPAERFMVLNGLERGAAVKAGERYKLVID